MTGLTEQWNAAMADLPLIAILRGITGGESAEVAETLFGAGFRVLEIPLNSPDPYATIKALVDTFPDHLIGAGTVVSTQQVDYCQRAGCRIAVAPNFNPVVASAVKAAGMLYCPGVATPSEAFAALEAGADALKLFPAEMITPAVVRAMRAVLPVDAQLIPVGGINPDNMAGFLDAGANGFGLGSALYKPGKTPEAVAISAQAFVAAMRT